MNNIYKKISYLLILGFIIQPTFALATSPTIDGAVTGTTAATTATSSTTTANVILKTLKDYGLDQVAYALAQKLGQKMATMTINKTTGGASNDKDPNFVQDFGTVLSKIDQQQKDLFTTTLLTSKNPFAKDIAKNILLTKSGDVLPEFTLSKVLTNGEDWTTAKNDFSVTGDKGLLFYSQLALPENTPVGSSMLAQNSLAHQIQNKTTSETLKLTSSGFLPNTKCNTSISSYKKSVQGIINNQNSNGSHEAEIEQAQALLDEYRDEQTQAIAQYHDGSPEANAADAKFYSAQQTLNNLMAADQNAIVTNDLGTAGNVGALTEDTAGCIEEMIKNPIATTTTLTNEAGKFGMDMTKNIQGWGQIVAGLFVSLFNGFVNKGLSSLKADYGQVKSSNVGGPEQLYEKGPNGTLQPITNFAKAPVNIVDLRSDFEKASEATQKNIDAITAMRTELIKVPVRLAYLDICLPGPDSIGLDKRMDDYYSQQTGWIQKKSASGSDDKRNTYQEAVLNLLDRDFTVAKAETQQDTIDDSRNIPGAGAMHTAINRFNTRRPLWTSSVDSLAKASDALSQLRKINTDLKLSLQHLRSAEPTKLTSVPNVALPFTKVEWGSLAQTDKDLLYTWATAHAAPATPFTADDTKGAYVIQTVWSLWENPQNFLSGGKWSDEDAAGNSVNSTNFLAEKNAIRSEYSAITDTIPTDWEISKNEQLVETIKSENVQTDQMIHDCDKMRELIVGDPTGHPAIAPKFTGDKQAFLADLSQNKDTYFLSDEVKNSITLPNIFNSTRTYEDDGCRPIAQDNYQASSSSGRVYGDHTNGYSCYGKFGHLYGIETSEGCLDGCDFDTWLDAGSNIYISQPHISSPTELYTKSRTLKFVPDPDPYGTGWTLSTIDDGTSTDDGGNQRGTFCRISSVLRAYGENSGYILDRNSKDFFCSSKWTDLSLSEAIASFITNQVK